MLSVVEAMLARDGERIDEEMARLGDVAPRRAETVKALLWLRNVRQRLARSLAKLTPADLEEPLAQSGGTATRWKPSLADPALKAAIQITLASGIAMVFGLMLSRERWFWAVLAAFLVFTNTRSQAEIWYQLLLDARPYIQHARPQRAKQTLVARRRQQVHVQIIHA